MDLSALDPQTTEALQTIALAVGVRLEFSMDSFRSGGAIISQR